MNKQPSSIAFETPLATCVLEGEILYITTKPTPRTPGLIREHYRILRECAPAPACWLIDLGICQFFNEKIRQEIHRQLPRQCRALAIVAHSACARMVATVFGSIRTIPVRIFTEDEESEARTWIQSFTGDQPIKPAI